MPGPGYQLAAYYQPAREVGGDFYDFLELDNGHLGLVVGDVTDKGVPAAIVMATTRTMLRASAQRLDSPGEVLKRVNDVIVPTYRPTCSSPASTPSSIPRQAFCATRTPATTCPTAQDSVVAARSSGRRGCRSGCCPA